MNNRITEYLSGIFCFLWGFLIFIDYLYYHPIYYQSLVNFQYIGLISIITLIGGGLGYILLHRGKKKKELFIANGLGIFILFLLLAGIIIPMHFKVLETNMDISVVEVFIYLGKISYVLLISYFVLIVSYVLGAVFLDNLFNFSFHPFEDGIIKIALGIVFISLLMFLLGTLNLLISPLIWGIFISFLVLFWKKTFAFVKISLLQPISYKKDLNWMGFLSFYLTLIFIVLIYLQNIRPAPMGFDALNLYLNLPKIIYEEQGLAPGFAPYYWSLFVSLGYLLVNQIEVVISLSVAGGILSAFAIYAIGKKWLSINYALLTVLLFYSLPLVNFQSYRDIKTDLGLLFILLSIVLVLVNYLTSIYSAEYTISITNESSIKGSKLSIEAEERKLLGTYLLGEENVYLLLLGMLSGVALGIKLTALILIFSVVAILFYLQFGQVGFFTSVILIFLAILIGGLDVPSGLRVYHLGTDSLCFIALGLGLIGLGFMFYKNRRKFFHLVKICILYGFFSALTYLPWPIKHYKETKVLSFQTIIKGKGLRPAPIK